MSVKRLKPRAGRPARRPGERATKDRIFDAAVELFADKGYDGVSIRDIARAVGITEGAVYKHYTSKDAILDAIFAYVEGRIYPPVPPEALDAMVDALSLREILESTPKYMIADTRLTRVTRIMLIEMYHNEKIGEYVRRELFERPVDETEVLFKKLIEKGKIRPCDPRALATQFISCLVYWYFEVFVFNYGKAMSPTRMEKMARARIGLFIKLLEPGI